MGNFSNLLLPEALALVAERVGNEAQAKAELERAIRLGELTLWAGLLTTIWQRGRSPRAVAVIGDNGIKTSEQVNTPIMLEDRRRAILDWERSTATVPPQPWDSPGWETVECRAEDVHVFRSAIDDIWPEPTSTIEPLVGQPTTEGNKHGRPKTKRTRAMAILEELYPKGVPKSMGIKELARAVNTELAKRKEPIISPDTARRARDDLSAK